MIYYRKTLFGSGPKLTAVQVGYPGAIVYDSTKQDGAPRKLMSSKKLNSLGWVPSIPLIEGLQKTYAHFLDGRHKFF